MEGCEYGCQFSGINNLSTTLPKQRINRNEVKRVHMKGTLEMEQIIRISGALELQGKWSKQRLSCVLQDFEVSEGRGWT